MGDSTPDFRILVTYPTHRKTIKMVRVLGPVAVLCHLKLMAHVRQHRTDGWLTGMSIDDIEIEAGWEGEPGEFVGVLLEVGYLDNDPELGFGLHDWTVHNPYSATFQMRSAAGKKGAEARWSKRNGTANGNRMPLPSKSDAPSPTPIPDPIPNPDPSPGAEDAFVARYHELCPSLHKCLKLNDSRRANIRKRLGELKQLGWTVDQYLNACEAADWLAGRSKKKWKADIEFITKRSKFLKICEGFYESTSGKPAVHEPSGPTAI